jgi:alpha-beta hydrolase superfamily lysophospholipase
MHPDSLTDAITACFVQQEAQNYSYDMDMEKTRYTEFQLTSKDGTSLFARAWRPVQEPRAWITLCPGTSDHAGRYDHMGHVLNEAGFALVMPDLRGNGQSQGKRGHIDSFAQYTDDLQAALDYTRGQCPKAHFLGGHSLGGLVAAKIAIENPPDISGVFLSGAPFKLAFDPPAWKTSMSRLLTGVLPSLQLGNELDAADLSHDPQIVERQRKDPYNHGKVTLNMYVELLKAQQEVMNRGGQLKLPLLILHGGADKINAVAGSEAFYSVAGSKEKQVLIYDGFYHEIFNEIGKVKVFSDLINWMDSILNRRQNHDT